MERISQGIPEFLIVQNMYILMCISFFSSSNQKRAKRIAVQLGLIFVFHDEVSNTLMSRFLSRSVSMLCAHDCLAISVLLSVAEPQQTTLIASTDS